MPQNFHQLKILTQGAWESVDMQMLSVLSNETEDGFDVCGITKGVHSGTRQSGNQNFESSCLCSKIFITKLSLLLLEYILKMYK
jgi:hypothetical protein